MTKIKGLVLDIDGILVGSRKGYNFPEPHTDVLEAIKQINQNKIKVSLCTARPSFSTFEIIKKTQLDNWHIANNGAEIFNYLDSRIINHTIKLQIAKRIVNVFTNANIYTEVHHPGKYYIQTKHNSELAKLLADVRRQNPVLVDKLEDSLIDANILRILVAFQPHERTRIDKLLVEYKELVDINLSTVKSTQQQFYIITQKGISKESGIYEISKRSGINLENMLGVGDGVNDWEFMKHCGYKATLENAHKEVLDLVTKYPNSYIGPSVDENGILDVFKHYKLIK